MKRGLALVGALVLLTGAPAFPGEQRAAEEASIQQLSAEAVDPHLGSQWAIDFLDLTEAWEKVKGNAYVDVIDLGLEVNHEDLRAFPVVGPKPGNFRLHLSYDLRQSHDDPCPDELESSSNNSGPAPCDGTYPPDLVGPGGNASAGHGTHVSGIVAATPDNGVGVTGACRHCSLLMSRISTNATDIPQALYWGVDRGSQVLSGSFGIFDSSGTVACPPPPGQSAAWDQLCEALALADQRDVVMVFAAGNNLGTIDFPARYPGAIAVGGVEQDRQVWRRDNDPGDVCPNGAGNPTQCGSNFGPQLDVIAPAENIFSTAYTGRQWPGAGECGDGSVLDGYGYCTGTSMATPYVSGIVGLVRSANPLLTKQNVYDILTRSADLWPARNDTEGYGVPNAREAVDLALGLAPGRLLANRLTPLFSLYSPVTEDHLYTTVPQVASSAVSGLLHGSCTSLSRQDCPTTWFYQSVGPAVPGYASFPGVPPCNVSPCFENTPGGSVYVFTSEAAPYAGASALVPLYRMTYKGTNPNGNPEHRDTTYTTSVNGLNAFRSVGYELDGIEGYVFPRCSPEPGCMPAGTVRLFRRYHPQRDDFAIFPESQLAQMESAGYTSNGGSNLVDVIGYAYPNADSDGDHVIDGFEGLIGTDASRNDTDCDGLSDGTEALGYPYTDPLGPGCFPPVARFSFTCSGLSCSFDSSGSTDNVGIVSRSWSFGGSSVTAGHTFPATGAYTVTLTVTDSHGLQSSVSRKVSVASPSSLAAEGYFTVPPCRVLDTRGTTPLDHGQIRVFSVAGSCGIPASAKAVSLTVTAIAPTGNGNLAFFPGDQTSSPFPASVVNFNPGASPRANNSVLRLATDGSGTVAVFPSVFAGSPPQVHLTVDVDGFFSEDVAAPPGSQGPYGYQPVPLCRLHDTRSTNSPVTSGSIRSFDVDGLCGIPSGVPAAALSLVVVGPTSGGHSTLFQAGTAVPGVSTVNFIGGTTALANGARTRLAGAGQDVSLNYVSTAPATMHVVLDTYGYFSGTAPLKYRPVIPCRAVDTRYPDQGAPLLTAGQTRSFQIQGNCGVPVGAKAVMANLVAFSPVGPGHLIAFPSGTALPASSTVNYHTNQGNTAVGTIVPLSTAADDLSVRAVVSDTHLILDVFGYFQ